MTYLIYITAFILGIIAGYLIKKCPVGETATSIGVVKISNKNPIKVFPKAQPTTYKEKQQRAIKEGKPIIKTFHK